MTTLVIHTGNIDEAGTDDFGDLFEKVCPDELKVIYNLGSPDNSAFAGELGGIIPADRISIVHHRPITEDHEFKRGRVNGDTHWGEYISDLADALDLDVERHLQNDDLHFSVTSGSSYFSGCLQSLGDILGARIWSLVGPPDERKAVDVTMTEPIEQSIGNGPSTQRPLSEMEAGVLSRMVSESLGGSEWIEGGVLCAGKGKVPKLRGLSTIMDCLVRSGLVEKRTADSVEYSLTDLGFLHAICELSRGNRLEPMDSDEDAVLMFHGGNKSPEEESKIFRSYLNEHGLNGLFDRYSLIAIEWGDDTQNLESMRKMLSEVLGGDDLLSSSSISSLLCSDEADFHSTASRLLSEVHTVESKFWGNWTMVIEKIPAQLRGVVLRYCRASGAELLCVIRRRGAKGAKGETNATLLGKDKHRFRLPNEDEIISIRGGLELVTDSLVREPRQIRKVVSTILVEKDGGGNGKIEQKDLGEYNHAKWASGDLRFGDDDAGKQQRSRGVKEAEKSGLIHREGKSTLSLTPTGEILARISLLIDRGK